MAKYEVRIIQKYIPEYDPDDDEIVGIASDREEITVVCSCKSLQWAERIREHIAQEIAEASGYIVNIFTPEAVIVKIEKTETMIRPETDPEE